MQAALLLLADRNRHVREFLRRELEQEGHTVVAAGSAQDILTLLAGSRKPDLLILDLEVPFVREADLLAQLQTFYPTLPVLIYSFRPENPEEVPGGRNLIFLEKDADPSALKQLVASLLSPALQGAPPSAGGDRGETGTEDSGQDR